MTSFQASAAQTLRQIRRCRGYNSTPVPAPAIYSGWPRSFERSNLRVGSGAVVGQGDAADLNLFGPFTGARRRLGTLVKCSKQASCRLTDTLETSPLLRFIHADEPKRGAAGNAQKVTGEIRNV